MAILRKKWALQKCQCVEKLDQNKQRIYNGRFPYMQQKLKYCFISRIRMLSHIWTAHCNTLYDFLIFISAWCYTRYFFKFSYCSSNNSSIYKVSSMNDLRPVALTSVTLQPCECIVLQQHKSCVQDSLDPCQFAYQNNRSCEDALLVTMNHVTFHLDQ